MKLFYCIFTTFIVVSSVLALPNGRTMREEPEEMHRNCAGEASRRVATSMLKFNADSKENLVFSPFGYSTILSYMGEGTRGNTFNQIRKVLGLQADIEKVRKDYRDVLKYLQGSDPMKAPQFKTWFYIYANNTVDNEYKRLLADNYFVEVKTITREIYDWSEPKTSVDHGIVDKSEPSSTAQPIVQEASVVENDDDAGNSKDIIGFEDLKKSKPNNDEQLVKSELPLVESEKPNNDEKLVNSELPLVESEKPNIDEKLVKSELPLVESEKLNNDEKLVKSEPPLVESEKPIVDDAQKSEEETLKEKECSKFDQAVDDKQYVEVPEIKKEIQEQDNIEDNETVQEGEKFDNDLKKTNIEVKEVIDEPIKISLPLKKLEDTLEIMHAVESHPLRRRFYGQRSLHSEGDIASALSGNSLIGEKVKSEDHNDEIVNGEKYESKMLMFNGLYFRGSWGIPFQQLRSEPEDVFHVSETEKVPVTMMRTRGEYRTSDLDEMNAQAIELPYENQRYSMLIILSKSNDGISKIIQHFDDKTIANIDKSLEMESVNLNLPKFRMDTTSRAEKALAASGISSLFTETADFSGITTEMKLRLDELVQHVTLKVDEGASSENFLTASSGLRDADGPELKTIERVVTINRPFLFFVRDMENDVIMVAGKYMTPPEISEHETEEDKSERKI